MTLTTNNMRYALQSGNYIETVRELDVFMKEWDFLLEGLDHVNNKADADIDKDAFLKRMLMCMTHWPDAAIPILYSKSGKRLGFGAGFDSTPPFSSKRSLYIYCLYSNGLYHATTKDLLAWTKMFAKQNNYQILQMETARFNGGAARFFQKDLGFGSRKLLFSQEVS